MVKRKSATDEAIEARNALPPVEHLSPQPKASFGFEGPETEETLPNTCGYCAHWRPAKDDPRTEAGLALFGGCVQGGTTTTYYGDTDFKRYTTDLTTCSAFKLHDRFKAPPPPLTEQEQIMAERRRNEEIARRELHRLR